MIERATRHLAGSIPVVEETSLDVMAEEIAISRQTAQGATVRIATTTFQREQQVEEELGRETVEIERIPIGRMVDATPAVRDEDDVTIIPVMEEVLVVERRLVLKEEIRIRRVRTTEVHRETVQLREQAVTITRTEPPGEATYGAASIPTTPMTNERENR